MAIPPTFRQRWLECGGQRGSVQKLANEFGVHPQSVYRWRKQLEAEPESKPAERRRPRPLSIFSAAGVPSEGIEKRDYGYLVERLIPHLQWLEEIPNSDHEYESVLAEAQWMRERIATKLHRPGWLTMSYAEIVQLVEMGKRPR